MRNIRPAFLLVTALLASLLAACGSTSNGVAAGCKPADNINTSTLNLVLPGKLTDATDIIYPPQEYVDTQTHAYTGMEIDLINEFAKRMCLTPNVQNVQFSTIIAGLTSTTAPGSQYYDMSISAFTITTDRQKQVDMIPYFQAGESILVPNGNPKNVTASTANGLDKSLCGLSVGVESGTTEEGEIKNVPGTTSGVALNDGTCKSNPVKLQSLGTQALVMQQFNNGSFDATYQDSPVSKYFGDLYPGKYTEIQSFAPSPEGIVVRKDNAPFESAIKQLLSDIRADGTYKAFLDKWHLTRFAYPPIS